MGFELVLSRKNGEYFRIHSIKMSVDSCKTSIEKGPIVIVAKQK